MSSFNSNQLKPFESSESIESIEFNHEQSEEEAEEEHEAMLEAAMRESEESGIPFDHIMGEILGGMRDNY